MIQSWSLAGIYFIPRVNQSLGRGGRSMNMLLAARNPALLRSIHRDGRDRLWAPFFVTHTHSAYLDTGAGCEPTSLPLYQDDPHLTLSLSPGHCSMMSLMPPMSPSRCLHVDLISVSVWLPVKLCTPVHCTCQFSLSFTRWAQVLTLTGTGPGPWPRPVYIRRRPPHVLCTNAGLEKIEEDKK